jgi:4-amino-4-deoxy-L-arabinose transferase-like glycosyltransferase
MLQAFTILPVLAVVYLCAAPTGWWRRVWQVFLMGVSALVAAGWWVAAVALTPAADRPYVGGSQDNSILNLIFGYNGFGRLSGNEAGSVGGGNVRGAMWGPTGWTRLFNAQFGNMMSWLLPGALVMGAVLLVLTVRARRTDRERAALLLWGGSLVCTGLVISLAQGIIHPYYAVVLAPPLGALVGIATMGLWERRETWAGRVGLAAALGATVIWSDVLLGRTPSWFPALRPFVAAVGSLGVIAILAWPALRTAPRAAKAALATLGLAAALAAPLFSTVATAATPHSGAIPTATPTPAGGLGGGFPGGPGGFRRSFGGGFPGGAVPGGAPGGFNAGPFGRNGNAFPGGAAGGFPGFPGGSRPFGGGGARIGGPGGGGVLNSSSSNPALTRMLQAEASRYAWAAATVNSNSAAGYQLASGEPVMAIGGFNGTDPAPTLAQFEKYVSQGEIHYFIAGGGAGRFLGLGGASGSGDDASRITSWVESHFTAESVGGVTVYDLTSGVS